MTWDFRKASKPFEKGHNDSFRAESFFSLISVHREVKTTTEVQVRVYPTLASKVEGMSMHNAQYVALTVTYKLHY